MPFQLSQRKNFERLIRSIGATRFTIRPIKDVFTNARPAQRLEGFDDLALYHYLNTPRGHHYKAANLLCVR
jgi:hypothetical protein